MADMFWPKGDALGRRIKYGQVAVAGAVADDSSGFVADTRRTGYDAVVRPRTICRTLSRPDSADS
jgi:hypothetical protein